MAYPDNPYGVTVGLNPGCGSAASNYAFWSNLLADMATLGLTWLRFQLSWCSIQLNQGDPPSAWSWGPLDDAVSHANAANINLCLTIRGAPAWALLTPSQKASTEPFFLPDPYMWAEFAHQLALRYNGTSGHGTAQALAYNEDWDIHHTQGGAGLFGIWNSPYAEYNGLGGVPPGALIEPARDPHFAALPTQLANNAFRQYAAAGTKIGLPCLWWRNFPNTRDFYQQLFIECPGIEADFGDYHHYSNDKDPMAAGSSPQFLDGFDQEWQHVQQALIGSGRPNMPIWVTEFGWQANTNTTGRTNVAPGSVTITLDDTSGAAIGGSVLVDTGLSQETVSITAKTATTITATFANSHTQPYPVVILLDCDEPTQATRYSAVLTSALNSAVVTKMFFFTLNYSTTGNNGSSLVYWNGASYVYRQAFTTLKNFITANPQFPKYEKSVLTGRNGQSVLTGRNGKSALTGRNGKSVLTGRG